MFFSWFLTLDLEQGRVVKKMSMGRAADFMAATSCGIEWCCFPSRKLQGDEVVIYPSSQINIKQQLSWGMATKHIWVKLQSLDFSSGNFTSAWDNVVFKKQWILSIFPWTQAAGDRWNPPWLWGHPSMNGSSVWIHLDSYFRYFFILASPKNISILGLWESNLWMTFFSSSHTEALDSAINVGHWG